MSKKEALSKEIHAEELQIYFENTCKYIEYKKTINPRFQAINI